MRGSIDGRFNHDRFGPFRGIWWHKHRYRTGCGEFRAWPIRNR